MINQLPILSEPYIQQIQMDLLAEKQVTLALRREDVIHPEVSGNKWRKLKYNLECIPEGHTLVTFGGAYSNHIQAASAACNYLNIPSIGIIRGERVSPFSPTLEFAESRGMKLKFVSRSLYRDKERAVEEVLGDNKKVFVLPEGGTNTLATRGCAEMMDESMGSFDIVACPVGTGGTIAGLISAGSTTNFLGFSALKADLEQMVGDLLSESEENSSWRLVDEYHFGGYARITPELISFIRTFHREHGVLLDPVYTGKMMFGLIEMIAQDKFDRGTSICAIHTGGLQGWDGIKQRFGIDPLSE